MAYAALEEIFKKSDVVSLHIPLTPETRHLVNAKMLSLMKKEAYLINTARGPILDIDAAVAAEVLAGGGDCRGGTGRGDGGADQFGESIIGHAELRHHAALCLGDTGGAAAADGSDRGERGVAFLAGTPRNVVN